MVTRGKALGEGCKACAWLEDTHTHARTHLSITLPQSVTFNTKLHTQDTSFETNLVLVCFTVCNL